MHTTRILLCFEKSTLNERETEVVEMKSLEIITGHFLLDEISKYDILNELQMLYVGEEIAGRKKNGEKYCAARKVSLSEGETERRERCFVG